MSDLNNPLTPYRKLGNQIKKSRITSKLDLSEVSAAIEIDEKTLRKIEIGALRPDEDILELLISYLNIEDKEADKLWDLAGYDESQDSDNSNDELSSKAVIMLLSPLNENKTSYSDFLDVHYDKNGMVLNFKQISGQQKPVDVARIGISYTQAQEIIRTIQRVLYNKQILKDNKKDN